MAPPSVPLATPRRPATPSAAPAGCIVLGARPTISVKQSDVLCSADGANRVVVESLSPSRLYYLIEGRDRRFCVFGELCGLNWSNAPRFIVRSPRTLSDGTITAEIIMQGG